MLSTDSWQRFEAEANRLGLIHRCAAPVAGLEKFLGSEAVPEKTTHAVMVLQAGGSFWEHLRTVRNRDKALDTHSDPLDTFTERIAARLATLIGDGYVDVRFPFRSDLDFVTLGEAMGVGRRSRLSILLHPRFGPWMAFRMLFWVNDTEGVLPANAMLGEHPCDGCPGYCRQACPADAFTGQEGKEQLDYLTSFQYRMTYPGVCETGCEARLACPAGEPYRYPADFVAYTQKRAFKFGLGHVPPKEAIAATGGQPKQGNLF